MTKKKGNKRHINKGYAVRAAKNKAEILTIIEESLSDLDDDKKLIILNFTLNALTTQPCLSIGEAVIQAHERAKMKFAKDDAQKKTKGIPEHIKRNIIKTKKAEEERKKHGRSLPNRTKVSGGRVSPR